jgi:rhodanese-related sulfurtransferase
MSSGWKSEHAGELNASAAFELLRSHPKAQLVDVRTKAEWTFVGVPDLTTIGKEVVLAEWQKYPTMEVEADFVDLLSRELSRRGVSHGDPLLLICRSGVRSLAAAKTMAAAGWQACHNVSGGFEGPLDTGKHRGGTDGWKALGLPWLQS